MIFQAITSACKIGVASVLARTGYFPHVHRDRLLILAFHRVVPESPSTKDFLLPSITTTPEALAKLLTWVRDRYRVISAEDVLRCQVSGWEAGRAYAWITFDDGWADNYAYAFPVVKRLGLTATFFVCPGLIDSGGSFWWYRLLDLLHRRRGEASFLREVSELVNGEPGLAGVVERYAAGREDENGRAALQRLGEALIEKHADEAKRWLEDGRSPATPLMTWANIEAMSAAGMSFGPHTQRHAVLTALSEAESREEIEGSWRALRDRPSVRSVPVLSYPSGYYRPDTQRVARAAGLRAAVTVDQKINRLPVADPFALARVNVDRRSAEALPLFQWTLARAGTR